MTLVSDLIQPTAIQQRYMLLPIEEGFNWKTCFSQVEAGTWYLVVFRSKHRADADEDLLTALDNAASSAARGLPGFLHYFIGKPLKTGECLSFCLWRSQEEAFLASAQPAHREAVTRGIGFYEYYRLERYIIRKHEDVLSFIVL